MSGIRVEGSQVLMSDLKDSGEYTPGSESEVERAALIAREEKANDSEMYSTRACLAARSCKIGLIMSIIALLLVLAALVLILVAGINGKLETPCNGITIDDVFDNNFRPHKYSGKWTNAGKLVHLSSSRGLLLFDPVVNHTTTLISEEIMGNITASHGPVADYKLSPKFTSNNVELLLKTNSEKVYRHSTLADYVLYKNSDVLNITRPANLSGHKIQFASWSPTGDHIALVIDYDIYLFNPLSPGTEPVAVTTGGSENGVYNGIPDWVYEEEVFATDHTLWWSDDGTAILYASFDDSQVREYSFPEYLPPENQYTTIKSIPYPKPGTTNPTVTVHVANITDLSNQVTVPAEDHYLIYAGWVSGGGYFACWLNRKQNSAFCCTYETGSCTRAFSESYAEGVGWVELTQPPIGRTDSDGNSQFYFIHPQPHNDDKFPALARGGPSGGVQYLTQAAPWEVVSIVGVAGDHILYVTTEKGPGTRHLHSYSTTTSDSVCLTCSQQDWGILDSPNPSLPQLCDYFSVSCDDNLDNCLLSCRGPCIPFSLFVTFNKTTRQLQPIRFMERNTHVHDAVRDVCLPTRHKFTVPADESGWALNGVMLRPPQFDHSKKYSVLVYVYGGPNSHTVDSSCILNRLSHLYYSTQLNIIVASVDGRGTGFRGQNFKFSVYRDLGNLETVDQLRGGRYLRGLSYVDGGQLAIMGASYGGYMAGRVGSSGEGVFSTAISQAPVTDWRYYDSIYTERYMNEPADNPAGYANSSVLSRAVRLSDVHYLLIHGTGDDNVHFQHSAQLVEALTQADVQFRLQIYTDKTHSISGGNTQRHLYQLIADFLREHLY